MRGRTGLRGRMAGVAGAWTLGMLALAVLLWTGAASAACPHGGAAISPSMTSSSAVASVPPSVDAGASRHAARPAVPPCCAGTTCTAMQAAVIGVGLAVGGHPGRSPVSWRSASLNDGLGIRPDLPPPRPV
ncbi:hypothetical protein [Azospirillum sp. TSO35-2]|uniref:hypothetical protein n=1 Tax=Azospirillum sp. TSO35-2 TaxID=716796 RepID=UPI0011B5B461|nr:hypothetical protein [Azospirillum sp. TSO35-2]